MTNDPFRALGLARTATAEEIRAARRRLAKEHHPDTGGDADRMRAVNAAAAAALRSTASTPTPEQAVVQTPAAATQRPTTEWYGVSRDAPSFTVEALPVETFEALLVVTSWLGRVLDDDPPYRLDTHLDEPTPHWCRLELVPEAGSSTVSISVAAEDGKPPNVETVRDLWVANLNRYDWPTD